MRLENFKKDCLRIRTFAMMEKVSAKQILFNYGNILII